MKASELIAFLQNHLDKQVVIETETVIAPVKKVETDCFSEGRPWVVLIEPDLGVGEDWEP